MARCLFQFKLNDMWLPCGKCHDCRQRRASTWAVRLARQAEDSSSAFFVTLTYNNERVPLTTTGQMTLYKKDCQQFFKNLRKLNKSKLKYFIVGEYGTKRWRPHYHAIIFNVNPETVPRAWTRGEVHIGEVNEASVNYAMKYITKPIRIPQYKGDTRQKEFALMSKGLGLSYVQSEKLKQWHNRELDRYYIPLPDGKKAPMPRYYKEKLYTKEKREEISQHIQNQSIQQAIQTTAEQIVQNLRDQKWKKQDKIRRSKVKRTNNDTQ